MTFTVFYFFLILLSSLISSGYAFFGYGVDRLKQSNRLKGESKRRSFGHRYHLTDSVEGTDCGPVKSFVYHGGVIDNFASKDDQFPWEGGQRYWVRAFIWSE
jgi:hypothetical protein